MLFEKIVIDDLNPCPVSPDPIDHLPVESVSHSRKLYEIHQDIVLVPLVLHYAALGVQVKIDAKVAVHQLQRIINRGEDTADPAVGIRLRVHLEHLPESRIGIGTGAAAECRCA